jgi:hypothetical protein
MNGRNIPFVKSVKYLSVIFDKKITWRLRIETVTTKAYRNLLDHVPCSKVTDKALNRSVVCLSRLGICGRYTSNEISAPAKQVLRITILDMNIFFQIPYLYDYTITKSCRQQAQAIQHHANIHIRDIGQGEA